MLETILAIIGTVVVILGAILAPLIYFLRKRDAKLDEVETTIEDLEKKFLEYQATALSIFRLKDDCINLHKIDDFQNLMKLIKNIRDKDDDKPKD